MKKKWSSLNYSRDGEARWPAQLESLNRSPVTAPVDRELYPFCACQPPAAAPRPRPDPVRAEFHAPPRVKDAQVGIYGMGGRARFSLDAGWYTVFARTGGSFVVYVVNGLASLASR